MLVDVEGLDLLIIFRYSIKILRFKSYYFQDMLRPLKNFVFSNFKCIFEFLTESVFTPVLIGVFSLDRVVPFPHTKNEGLQ